MQAQFSVNVTIGSPPPWGPAGYSNVNYYYLPDIEAYYDIRNSQFFYMSYGKWYRSKYLPRQYRNYDLYNGYKVVLNDYHGLRPYIYFNNHKVKYYKGSKGKPQKNIKNKDNDRGNYDNRWNTNPKKGNENKNHGKDKK